MLRSSLLRALILLALLAGVLSAQSGVRCAVTSVPATARYEGFSEQLGDIVFDCFGGPPGGSLNVNFNLFLNTNITNRILSDSSLDAFVLINRGEGAGDELSPTRPRLFTNSAVAYSGLNMPFNAQGRVGLIFRNLRGNMRQFLLPIGGTPEAVRASISVSAVNGSISIDQTNVVVALVQLGLRGLILPAIIDCRRQNAPPANPTITSFTTASVPRFSTRASEGFPSAFSPERTQPYYTGTRIRLSYNAVPTGLLLYTPDVIVGNSGSTPTSAGDFGFAPSGGTYQPSNSGSLLLVRVNEAAADGSGGTLVYTRGAVGSPAVNFNNLTQVNITNGSGEVLYEVVDSNPGRIEFGLIPTYGWATPDVQVNTASLNAELSLAPRSSVAIASTTAPIPRYQPLALSSDCEALGDCTSNYLPRLAVETGAVSFTTQEGTISAPQFVNIRNAGGGDLFYTVSVNPGGTPPSWLRVGPDGLQRGNSTLIVQAFSGNLSQGQYTATIDVDAGPFGRASIPVTLLVTAPRPTIDSLLSAATNRPQIALGSIASIYGRSFATANVGVTFDDTPAQVLYSSPTQLNVIVPTSLGNRQRVRVQVTANAEVSNVFLVDLTDFAPGIFAGAVLKPDFTFPSANNRAQVGSTLQVFATGLLNSAGQGRIVAKIHDRSISQPDFAGPAPGIPGVQQVNFVIPTDLPTMSTEVRLCNIVVGNLFFTTEICSPPVEIWIQR